jgi:hypothetical protein
VQRAVHLLRQRSGRDHQHRTRRAGYAIPRDPCAPQPPERAPPARSDHQEILIAAGELYKYGRDFAPHRHRFDVYVRRHSAERGVEGAPQPLPCGICPYLPQLRNWAAALSEIAARRNPGVHGQQNRVARSCFSHSMAQRRQAAH